MPSFLPDLRGFWAFLLGSALFCATPVHAQATNPLVDRGVTEYDELRFDEALQTLSAALVRRGNDDATRARIYRHLALTYLALNREEEAAGAWRSLLSLSPEEEPAAELSPRFRAFLARVREEWESEGRPGMPPPAAVTIQHRSPAEARHSEDVTLEAQLDDPQHRAATLVLAYRQGTSSVFSRREATRAEAAYSATIPGADVQPPLVEYYFEALDLGGLPIASRGDVAAPLRIAVPAPATDLTTEPWFWVGIGAGALVVAGAIVLGVVLGTQSTGPGQQGTLVITLDD
jgi:tetratricopeptide (TPR) repeat protein